MDNFKTAVLLLQDGRFFYGKKFGSEGETSGEVCIQRVHHHRHGGNLPHQPGERGDPWPKVGRARSRGPVGIGGHYVYQVSSQQVRRKPLDAPAENADGAARGYLAQHSTLDEIYQHLGISLEGLYALGMSEDRR